MIIIHNAGALMQKIKTLPASCNFVYRLRSLSPTTFRYWGNWALGRIRATSRKTRRFGDNAFDEYQQSNIR